jgi:SAM-dependent methyltransferase
MHPNSVLLFEAYAREHFRPGLRVLEIGPDLFPSTLRTLVGDESLQWDTLDLVDGHAHVPAELTYRSRSPYEFPIEDGAYDIVLSANVIEHVRCVWRWMPELARVCRAGGLVITIGPVSWPYHEAPIDCWRIYPEGMRALYEEASLTVLVSNFDALEAKRGGRRRFLPGRSPISQPWQLRLAFRILGPLGFPVEAAYDVITVGEKPARTRSAR